MGDARGWQSTATGHRYCKNVDCPDISSSRPQVTFAVYTPRWRTADIFTSKLDGTAVKHLTHTPDWVDRDPVFSPNGEWLAWSRRSTEGTKAQIMIMRADGTHKRRITPNSISAYQPDWSPGSGRLLFSTNRGLATIRTDGTRFVRWPIGGDSPAWAINGRRIAAVQDGGRCCDMVDVHALNGSLLPMEWSFPAEYISNISWQPLPL